MSRYGVNRFEPFEIFIERVNVASVKEAVNFPAFIEKVRYRNCAVRSAANVKENFFAHELIIRYNSGHDEISQGLDKDNNGQ